MRKSEEEPEEDTAAAAAAILDVIWWTLVTQSPLELCIDSVDAEKSSYHDQTSEETRRGKV